jgi:hypothetical protein
LVWRLVEDVEEEGLADVGPERVFNGCVCGAAEGQPDEALYAWVCDTALDLAQFSSIVHLYVQLVSVPQRH